MQDFWWGLSSNGAVTKYLQVLRGNEGFPSVCVCVRALWSNCCHSITLPLISACRLYLGAKAMTCLITVKYKSLCWHMETECNGCQTSRGWTDANPETGRMRQKPSGSQSFSLSHSDLGSWAGYNHLQMKAATSQNTVQQKKIVFFVFVFVFPK